MENLKKVIRDVPDFPKKGIVFKDITPLLNNSKAFKETVDRLSSHFKNKKIHRVVSMESRGFIFGSAVAYKLNCGFVPVRKKGKLPYETISITYNLEYGQDTLEIHKDAIRQGENVLIVDDVLATGGTAKSVAEIVEKLGGKIVGLAFIIELSFLKPRQKLKGYKIYSLIKY